MMKRKIALVLAALMISTTGTVVANAATPDTVKDSFFTEFVVSPNNYRKVDDRIKSDPSPIYLWYKTATNNRFNYLSVKAYGKIESYDSWQALTVNGNGEATDSVKAYLGTKHSVRSNVYELNENREPDWATLGFKSANYVEAQTAGGEWSPDALGLYTYAYS